MSNIFEPLSAKDIENKIEKLRKSYAPEWKFDPDDPDAGSVIAQIFARQLEENNKLMGKMPERYHLEFVNLLDATLRPARPAGSMVIFNMDTTTMPGTQIPKGTRLFATSDKTESGFLIYETDRNLYVTEARINNVFMTDCERGTLSPIFGEFSTPNIIYGVPDNEWIQEKNEIPPFTLFGETDNIGKSILTIYEHVLFDGIGEPIYIRLEGADETVRRIQNDELVFKYLDSNGFKQFDTVKLLDDNKTFSLIKDGQCSKVNINEKEYSVVILESTGVMTDRLDIKDITLSAGADSRPPEYAGYGTLELDAENFAPFTDSLAVYNECYIGHSTCFSKAGALITLTFNLSFHENCIRLTPKEEETEQVVIKRKPRKTSYDIPVTVTVDEIVLEYYNGIGWKKIKCETEYSGMFRSCESGKATLSFICPGDWVETESGPYIGRCLRMRIVKAENCYMRPAIHMYPTIKRLKIAYSYEGKFIHPKKLECIAGTKKLDITDLPGTDKPFTILSGTNYHEDALYIGLSKKPEEGPVSLYFQLAETGSRNGANFKMEYSTIKGFKEIKITDLTEGFTRSGTIIFMPPADMAEADMEGRKLYWLRLVRNKNQAEDYKDEFLPKISKLSLNAVTITNVRTLPETDYYIDEVVPNNSIPLGTDNILDADVWVNEKGITGKEEFEDLMVRHPERVRAEYDFLGRISAAYVLWDEAENFESAPHKRCYQIDRLTGNIHFSDGNKCDMPRITDDIAFKACIRSTDGENGNLSEGQISGFIENASYIESVYNPIRAHGGCNPETLDYAMERCAGIMHSREKLVSENDFERFVLEFSDSIDKCKVVVGNKKEGISIVLLMKDYADGAFSFHRISTALRNEIYKRCAITVAQGMIHIVEPVFVSISVGVFVMAMDPDEAFEVHNTVETIITEYLNPVSTKDSQGWRMGTLPKESQILMKLNSLRNKAVIQRIIMIGKYVDAYGEHELDIKDIEVTPFMVVKSGKHKVVITNK
ncbi:MAG: hypothetical protein J5802_07980 [Butyrivibrio sp.]|nr:hypothetical protein [Butyrivibrio sp.]